MFDFTHPKLLKLIEAEGYAEVEDFLSDYALDSIVPGICMSRTCDQTAEYEPDQRAGYCEACGGQTVQSGLVIAGLI